MIITIELKSIQYILMTTIYTQGKLKVLKEVELQFCVELCEIYSNDGVI